MDTAQSAEDECWPIYKWDTEFQKAFIYFVPPIKNKRYRYGFAFWGRPWNERLRPERSTLPEASDRNNAAIFRQRNVVSLSVR